jgi:hypothetical protein
MCSDLEVQMDCLGADLYSACGAHSHLAGVAEDLFRQVMDRLPPSPAGTGET